MKDWLVSIYKKGFLSSFVIIFLDIAAILVCSLISVFICDYLLEDINSRFGAILLIFTCTTLVTTILLSGILKTHRQLIRYSSVVLNRSVLALLAINPILVILFSSLLIFLFIGRMDHRWILLFWLLFSTLSFIAFVFIRYIIKYETIRLKNSVKGKEVKRELALIYGVRYTSLAVKRALEENSQYLVVGFITRKKKAARHTVDGMNIYNIAEKNDFLYLVNKLNIKAIIFSKEEDFLAEAGTLVATCKDIGVDTLLFNLGKSDVTSIAKSNVQNIKIGDILMRKEIEIEDTEVRAICRQKTILVTGAAGSIGSELARQIATFEIKQLVLFDNAETPMHNLRLALEENFPDLTFFPIIGDVRNIDRVRYVFERFRPQLVFHAAAYKHVPLMEENPCESVQVNVLGTKNVADCCIAYDVEKMVMVSTDKAVNPTNVMGACKRAAEIYVQSLGKQISEKKVDYKTIFVTTRFGNVIGSQGSVIHLFEKQIAKGGPVTVTHPEITRFFMSIPEACRLVLRAASLAKEARIYVFDMGDPVKIDDFARRMISLSGFVPDVGIKIVYTGLRPGEKLYEEVLADKENTIPTSIPKIKIAQIRPADYEQVIDYYDKLRTATEKVEIEKVKALLKEFIPEYAEAVRKKELDEKKETEATVTP